MEAKVAADCAAAGWTEEDGVIVPETNTEKVMEMELADLRRQDAEEELERERLIEQAKRRYQRMKARYKRREELRDQRKARSRDRDRRAKPRKRARAKQQRQSRRGNR